MFVEASIDDAVVPAIFTPLPLNVVTPVSLRNSARTSMSSEPVGPPRAENRPASQAKRGSAITGRSQVNASCMNFPAGSGNATSLACTVTRSLVVAGQIEACVRATHGQSGDGHLAHFQHDGIDGRAPSARAAAALRGLTSGPAAVVRAPGLRSVHSHRL
jgi:hypothetical protein